MEGKRKRKSIETFAISHEPKRPTSEYIGGVGVKLGDVTRSKLSCHCYCVPVSYFDFSLSLVLVEHSISRSTASELRSLHRLCFDRPGNVS